MPAFIRPAVLPPATGGGSISRPVPGPLPQCRAVLLALAIAALSLSGPLPRADAAVKASVLLVPQALRSFPELNVWDVAPFFKPLQFTVRHETSFIYNDGPPVTALSPLQNQFSEDNNFSGVLPEFLKAYTSPDGQSKGSAKGAAWTYTFRGYWQQNFMATEGAVQAGPVAEGAKLEAAVAHDDRIVYDMPATPAPEIHNLAGISFQLIAEVTPPEQGPAGSVSHYEAVIEVKGDFGIFTLTRDDATQQFKAEIHLDPDWNAYTGYSLPKSGTKAPPFTPATPAQIEQALTSGIKNNGGHYVERGTPIMLLHDYGPGEFKETRIVLVGVRETVSKAVKQTYTAPVAGKGVNETKSVLVLPGAEGKPPLLALSTGGGQVVLSLPTPDTSSPLVTLPPPPPAKTLLEFLSTPPPPLPSTVPGGASPPQNSPAGVERGVAGLGILGFGGDGGIGPLALFNDVPDMARDRDGVIYLIDNEPAFAGRVRRIDPYGNVATVAGGGSDNYTEGMRATEARLRPTGIAVDDQDRLFVSDDRTRRIYRLVDDGTFAAVAGSGGTDSNGDKGPALQASIAAPGALAFGPGVVLYLRDGNKLRFVTQGGTIDSLPLSGEGGGDIGFLGGMVVDPNGTLYVADLFSHHVNTVAPNGKVSLFAGSYRHGFAYGDGGKATEAGLTLPSDVDLDAAGNLYIADSGAGRLRKVDKDGIISTVAGRRGPTGDGGKATLAELFAPSGIARDAEGNLYVADTNHHLIRRIDVNDIITTVAGSGLLTGNGVSGFSGDDGPATSAMLNTPVGVAVDAAHNLYIADTLNHRIRRVTPDGKIDTVAGTGDADFSGDNGPALQAKLNNPTGIAVDGNGTVFFADSFNQRIRKFTPGGTITTVAGSGVRGFEGDGGDALFSKLSNPYGVATDGAGNLFIADTFNHRIRKVGTDGKIDTLAGNSGLFSSGGYTGDGGPAKDADLALPYGVSVGPDGTVYIADSGNNVVRAVTPDGKIDTVLGTGETGYSDGVSARTSAFRFPQALVAGADGALWVADTVNSRIRQAGIGFANPKPVAPGDVNFDGSIDVGDAVLVLQKIVGLADLQGLEARAADITCDGAIDVSDGVKILRVAVELEPGPAGCAP